MSEIGPIQPSQAAALSRIAPAGPASISASAGSPRVADDSVQFSLKAQQLSKIAQLPDVRQDLIDTARANIDAGFYDSDAVLDATIDNLAEDL